MQTLNSLQNSLASSVSESYLQKTIAMKNSHIAQLLEELKKTQQLHANLKKKYQADEIKLRQKINQLQRISEELKVQNNELIKKCKLFEATNQNNQSKFNKLGNEWQREIQSFRYTLQKLKLENHELKASKKDLQHRLKVNCEQLGQKDAKIQQLSNKMTQMSNDLAEASRKHQQKQQQWKKWNNDVTSTIRQLENKTSERKRVTLNDLEARIRNIMIDL